MREEHGIEQLAVGHLAWAERGKAVEDHAQEGIVSDHQIDSQDGSGWRTSSSGARPFMGFIDTILVETH